MRPALFIDHQLISLSVIAMHLSFRVFLHSIAICVVTNNCVSWQDSDKVSVTIVTPYSSKLIFYNPKTKIVKFLHKACLGINLKCKSILGIVSFPLSLLVLTDKVPF